MLNRKTGDDYNQLLPKFGLSYQLDEQGSNVYATVSKGYRAGGYNIQMFSDILQTELNANRQQAMRGNYDVPHTDEDYDRVNQTIAFKPETSWNYEVGTHLNLFDHRLHFDAGNEYRKFEFLDTDHPTMGIDAIDWDGSDYQVKVITDSPRPNYVYDEAAKGSFYIRNSDNVENNNTCEYAQIHFTLKAPKLPGDVYLNADWTYGSFLPEYRMEYDEMTKTYHARLFMKQGYYSYQYLMKMEDGSIRLLPSEGNFYQTQNKYNVLVYYRAQSDRTDRLVGYGELK
jgi:hypothetical protein